MGTGSRLVSGLVLATAAAFVGTAGGQAPPKSYPRAIVIVDGTIIDGSGAPPRHNDGLLIQNGRIRAIGSRAVRRPPADARRIDAKGKWILPGLIDGHVHVFQTGGLDARPDVVPNPDGRPYADVVGDIRRAPQVYLRAYVCSGITSVVDLGGPRWEFLMRDGRDDDVLSPHIALSGPLLATFDPPALDLEDDDPIWLMKDVDQTRALVATLVSFKPDLITIWFGHRSGDDLAAQATLVRAATEAGHKAGLRVAVHATTLDTARRAVEAGADILVHSVSDREVDDEFVRAVVSRNVIYIPTLIVGTSYREVMMRQVEFEPFERDCAPPKTIASFDVLTTLPASVLPRPTSPPPDQLPLQQRNLKRLADAGAMIVAGTDAGSTRTLHGPSLHREFVLMAEAGMTPMQILVSATAHGAVLMGRAKELGQIQEGRLADLIILDADPLVDIHNTRQIVRVIRGGAVYER